MTRSTKPVLFVTGHAPPDRVGAFARLHEVENVEFALFGGRSKHGGGAFEGELPFPHRHIANTSCWRSPRADAIAPSSAPPAGASRWARLGRARVAPGLPLILWSSLWAHPRSAAHALSFLALRRLYRSADAVVTYGPHVSAYVRARGAHNVHIAPQAVDNAFWRAREIAPPQWPTLACAVAANRSGWPEQAATKFLFAGRPSREKGLRVLFEAWRTTGLQAPPAALVLVGVGSNPPWVPTGGAVGDARDGILWMDPIPPVELRNIYAACDVLVVPSIATPTFREPWGLVVNEAMNQGLPVIATDAVGAVAGGLVRDGHNGLVVPAGERDALAEAINRLAAEPELRAQFGEAGAQDVRAYTYDAWADGFSSALASLGLSRRD